MHPVSFNFSNFNSVYSNRDYFTKNYPGLWEDFFSACYNEEGWNSLGLNHDDVFFNLINLNLVDSCICSAPGRGTIGVHGYSPRRCGNTKLCWRCSSSSCWEVCNRIPLQPSSSSLFFVTLKSPKPIPILDPTAFSTISEEVWLPLVQNVSYAAKNSFLGGAYIAKEVSIDNIDEKLFNFHVHAVFRGDVSLLNVDNWKGRKPIESENHLRNCIRYIHKPVQDCVRASYKKEYRPAYGKEFNRRTQEILDVLIEGTYSTRKFVSIGTLRNRS